MRYIKTIPISENCRIIYSADKEAKKVVYWVEVLNKYNFWEQCPDDIIDNIRKNRPITDSERRYWSTIERAAEIFGDPLLHYDEACFVAPGKRSAIITETQNAETLIDWLSSRGIFIISNNRFYSSIPPPQRRMLLREIFTIN